MQQRPRIYYTAAQKALMWDRWKAGDTLHEIGKLFDRPHTSIQNILSATGGIRPPDRHRSRLALSMAEREEISRALAAGESIRCVAKRLKRAPSTIAESFGVMAERLAIVQPRPMKMRGTGLVQVDQEP